MKVATVQLPSTPTSGSINIMTAAQAVNADIPQMVQAIKINATVVNLILSCADSAGHTVGISYSATANPGFNFIANTNAIDLNQFRLSRGAGSGIISVEVWY